MLNKSKNNNPLSQTVDYCFYGYFKIYKFSNICCAIFYVCHLFCGFTHWLQNGGDTAANVIKTLAVKSGPKYMPFVCGKAFLCVLAIPPAN